MTEQVLSEELRKKQRTIDESTPPPDRPANLAEVGLSLWDLTKALLAKSRVPRNIRNLYTRALVVAKAKELPSLLEYVNTDLQLRISEDGKGREEILLPFEHLLSKLSKVVEKEEKSGF